MTHSVVVPVYRNEATLPELLRRIAALQLRGGESFEVIFVVDGSPDNSFAYLKLHLAELPFASQLVNLSRNFGSFAAIRAGMTLATGDFIGMLAADLQQPLSSRSDPFLSRVAATTFWRLYRFFVQSEIPAGGIDSFACTRQVRDILVSLPEANSTLVGLLVWVGFRRDVVTYPRAARTAGKSGWSFARKLRYAFDTAFAFSDLPITIMIVAGALGVGGALAIGAAVTVAWALGTISVAGYTPLMLVALFSFSTTLLALGIVGGYVWRIFENTKGRPTHLIRSVERVVPAPRRQTAAEPQLPIGEALDATPRSLTMSRAVRASSDSGAAVRVRA